MATAPNNENPACEPVSLMPVPNKLQDRMNTLREVIDSKKSLVRRVSEEMKELIEDKTQLIIRELEEEINKRKSELEKLFQDLDPSLPNPLDKIPEAIESVKREMNIDIPFINLNCKVRELRESINTLFSCDQRIVKFEENTPIQLKWSSCDRGKQDNQLYNPCGIVIDSINDEIYVTDSIHRVQIFSRNGEWVNSFKDEVMADPENILILHNSILVQCRNRIVKFNKSTLKRESHKTYEYQLSCICNDNTHIYVGEYRNMKLTVLTSEMNEEKRISLITQFKQDNTFIRDISLAKDEVYVCFTDSDYPIQAFSKQGRLTRCIIHKDMLNEV
ncbi:hypothetical protein LOD99_8362 [Oopsacas minuta]|uniref:Uncharacterized protein n=1 Tax=Oopsacas minuta TaxID=111878 RepID=A0AAV7JGS3_9METZ|nr:hypothetical protein LOD99_8362 [Oopsacas minuta]